MTKEQIDKLWNEATKQSIEQGEMYTRYIFARFIEAHTLENHRQERNKIELWRSLALTREGDGRAIAQIEKEAAEKERKACELACAAIQKDRWNLYKGYHPYNGDEKGRADPFIEGIAEGAELCEQVIRARGES